GLGVVYTLVVRHAFDEDNAILADKVTTLSADLNESGADAFAEELTGQREGEHPAYWIRMLDSQGRTYAETPGMNRLLPPEIFPSAEKSPSAFRSQRDHGAEQKLFSLVA